MLIAHLTALLKARFPHAAIADDDAGLRVGSFPEWDSMAHFDVLLSVEERFDIRFSVEQMAELKSLDDIARALAALGVSG